jgi:hypothetical protein
MPTERRTSKCLLRAPILSTSLEKTNLTRQVLQQYPLPGQAKPQLSILASFGTGYSILQIKNLSFNRYEKRPTPTIYALVKSAICHRHRQTTHPRIAMTLEVSETSSATMIINASYATRRVTKVIEPKARRKLCSTAGLRFRGR